MHHTHVHEDLLLMYILFARRTHEHEGTIPIFTSFALMHIAKIHVTHCLLCHVYPFSYFYDPPSHDCIHVGGANACCMSFQSFTFYFFISLSKALMYVVINTTKKYTSVMIRVCHSRSRFLSCMYIHDNFMTKSR